MSIKEHLADGVRIGETPDDRYKVEYYELSRESWNNATRDVHSMLRDFGVNNVGVLVIPNITPTCAFEPKTATMLVNPLFFDEDADKDSFGLVGDGSDLSIRRGAIIHELELVTLSNSVNPTVRTSYSEDGQNWSAEKSRTVFSTSDKLTWFHQGFFRNWRIQRFKGNSDSHLSFARLEAQIEGLQA